DLLQQIRNALENGKTSEYELDWIGKNTGINSMEKGNKVFCEGTIFPIFSQKDTITHAVITYKDVSDRKKAEEDLLKSEEELRAIVDNSVDAIGVSQQGIHRIVNPAFLKMFGYQNAEDLIGKPVFELIAPDERKRIKQFVADRIEGKSVDSHYQTRGLKKDGTEFDMEVNAAQYGQEDIKNTLVILRDVTNRNRLEEQLRQSQKMESIGNLAGGIAHDFNNLLFPILGMSEMLLEDLPKDSLEYENVQVIFNAGRRAGDLVQQILAFSRQSEHKMTPVRVQSVLKEVLKLSRSTIPTNIAIQPDIQQNCGLVMADPTQIHQVVMNLITNAFHAIEDKNGAINIELKEITLHDNELPDSALQAGQYVRLTVSDNGIGMSQNTIHNIFDPYFTTKKKGKGTGLGLAVVYGIVKEYGGEIKVSSKEEKGTTFTIYLPLMKKSSDSIIIDNVPKTAMGTENILLVDDEVSVAKLESQMLSRLGYQVTVKTNSDDALSVFSSNPDSFDLVLSDMTMPNMTGDQLSKKILSIKPDIPIIICTGFSERINKEQAETIGVRGFLMKPVVKSELAQMIRDVLDESKNT
ncbi:MAG: PAS domain S-box protein, partial [Desulfobacteraceae bacterium]|nr:PAS domain S-box protein [Desulfobacteraceae bacterium]